MAAPASSRLATILSVPAIRLNAGAGEGHARGFVNRGGEEGEAVGGEALPPC